MRRGRAIGRAGRPSLIGTAARTAVIAGTATAVSGRVAQSQAQQAAGQRAQQEQAAAAQQAAINAQVAEEVARQTAAPAPAPAPAATDTSSLIDQLTRLGELRSAGILTEDEFAAQKARLLGS